MSSHGDGLHDDLFLMDGLSSKTTPEYAERTVTRGGIDAKHETVSGAADDFRDAIDAIRRQQRLVYSLPNVSQARTVDDLRADGCSVVFGFQNTTQLEDEPEMVGIFEQLGVRVIQLTYNERNRSADGCTERVDAGLSRFGLEVIEEIESANVVLDLSHVGHTSAREALEAASRPTIFSHSNSAGVLDHPRNVPDDLVRAAAETGGTIGVNAFPDFVAAGRPTLDDFVDHVSYLRDLVGAEHVSLGLDFLDQVDTGGLPFLDDPEYSDPPYRFPEGLESAADLPNLTSKLVERGFTEDEIRGIMGENLLRVFEAVWEE